MRLTPSRIRRLSPLSSRCLFALTIAALTAAGCGPSSIPDPVVERREALMQGDPDELVIAYYGANESVTAALESMEAPFFVDGEGNLTHVELGGRAVTDRGLSLLADQVHLKALDLPGTKITDEGMQHLEKLTALETLNLSRTAVTDAGLEKLASLKSLKRLYVSETEVTDAGMNSLKSKIPGLEILKPAPKS